ncbi:hypothetical protein [Kitasatospora sp. DSM 101779]|uniref:hypothetical protein n=1 Tax=Kitasatospora sp. DSM 101779 TaxID=2853165 RepID=UPI0021D9F58F|nr:hypothetical protein [Kitasatospora sp. DSM 101779]MCU7827064.1 hypothetical protein [Kitasatospora sp. DSM 101779]
MDWREPAPHIGTARTAARDHLPVAVRGAAPAARRALHGHGLDQLVSLADRTAAP